MAALTYFDLLPSVSWRVPGETVVREISDITRRFRIRQLIAQGSAIMYDYTVKDGERPDTVAFRYYGDSGLDWLIMLANEIHDRYFRWPLDQSSLDAYIRQRYGSIAAAMASIHRYELVLQERIVSVMPDGTELVTPERVVTVDQTTWLAGAASTRRTISVFTHETDLNDARRIIRLIDKRHVPYILSRVQEIYET